MEQDKPGILESSTCAFLVLQGHWSVSSRSDIDRMLNEVSKSGMVARIRRAIQNGIFKSADWLAISASSNPLGYSATEFSMYFRP
eukprot:scaffold1049_cov168-Amphora_coffeaeformis.AAC.13